MPADNIRRGQVWWWNCPKHNREHIHEGDRPVVIISNDICNAASPVVAVVPFTTVVKKPYPQQVPLIFDKRVSIAIVDQLTSIPKSELDRLICTLADFQMEQVDKAIACHLGLALANRG
jgi:mRNA interferase MazF